VHWDVFYMSSSYLFVIYMYEKIENIKNEYYVKPVQVRRKVLSIILFINVTKIGIPARKYRIKNLYVVA